MKEVLFFLTMKIAAPPSNYKGKQRSLLKNEVMSTYLPTYNVIVTILRHSGKGEGISNSF